jgi:hypothetical protein
MLDGWISFQADDGERTTADPPTLSTAAPNWLIGSMIYLGRANAASHRSAGRRGRPTARADR